MKALNKMRSGGSKALQSSVRFQPPQGMPADLVEEIRNNPPMASLDKPLDELWPTEDDCDFMAPPPDRPWDSKLFFDSYLSEAEIKDRDADLAKLQEDWEERTPNTSPFGPESSLVFGEDGVIEVTSMEQMAEFYMWYQKDMDEGRMDTELDRKWAMSDEEMTRRVFEQGVDGYRIRKAEVDRFFQEGLSNIRNQYHFVVDGEGFVCPIIPDEFLTMVGIPGNEHWPGEFGDPDVPLEAAKDYFDHTWGEKKDDHHHHDHFDHPIMESHKWSPFGFSFVVLFLGVAGIPFVCYMCYLWAQRKFFGQ